MDRSTRRKWMGGAAALLAGAAGALWLRRRDRRPADDPRLRPYDEQADARAELAKARQMASQQSKQVLVVFGANWCPDCRILERTVLLGGALGAHLAARYVRVKVDVGQFDRHMDIDRELGHPTRAGIPSLAITDAQGKVLRLVDARHLARAQHRGEDSIIAVIDQGSVSGA